MKTEFHTVTIVLSHSNNVQYQGKGTKPFRGIDLGLSDKRTQTWHLKLPAVGPASNPRLESSQKFGAMTCKHGIPEFKALVEGWNIIPHNRLAEMIRNSTGKPVKAYKYLSKILSSMLRHNLSTFRSRDGTDCSVALR